MTGKCQLPLPVFSALTERGTPTLPQLTSPQASTSHPATMGLIKRALKISAAGTVASIGVFWGATRNDVFEPMQTSDPIFQSPFFKKFNPEQNPTLHDLCVRRIPLDKIKPELLENKAKLTEAFCAGVWGGMGKLNQPRSA